MIAKLNAILEYVCVEEALVMWCHMAYSACTRIVSIITLLMRSKSGARGGATCHYLRTIDVTFNYGTILRSSRSSNVQLIQYLIIVKTSSKDAAESKRRGCRLS